MKKFFTFITLMLMLCSPCRAEDLSVTCQNGTFVGVLSSDNVITWLGVPYAKPPVGSLRWKAPEAPEASTETFDADTFSAMPLQAKSEGRPASLMPQDEDCLYLNVWKASDDSVVASRPVMVWIHGGSFRANGTGEPEWQGHQLAADKPEVIVVSVGYRLGLMGFIDFSEVPGGNEFTKSGNLGILDVLQSLKWLNANIAAFGGDPKNITVFGQSSGSALISLLMTIPEAKDYFQRAILQSGGVSMSMAKNEATQLAKKLLELTGKTDMTGLMSLSSMDLQLATASLDGALNFPERDGVVLTSENIYEAFAKNAKDYDILIGSNADEVRYFLGAVQDKSLDIYAQYVGSAYDTITKAMSSIDVYGEAMLEAAENFISIQGDTEPVWAYTEFLNDLLFRGPAIKMASSHTGSGKTYMYYWNVPTADPFRACHAIELPYIFNINSALVPETVLESDGGNAVRTLTQNMWIDFAVDGIIEGKTQYTSPDLTTIIMSSDATIISEEKDPLSKQRELITPLLEMGVSGREIINAMSSPANLESNPEENNDEKKEAETVVPNKESNDTTKTPGTTTSDDIGSSGAGCNSGMFPLIFMLLVMPMTIRKNY